MTRRAAHIASAWFTALVQLVSISFASGMVLCVADDGHITLEAPHANARCLTDYNRHHPGSSQASSFEIEHHGCKDTLVSQVAASRHDETWRATALGRPLMASPQLPLPPLGLPALQGPKSTVLRPGSQLASLRSVVLLV